MIKQGTILQKNIFLDRIENQVRVFDNPRIRTTEPIIKFELGKNKGDLFIDSGKSSLKTDFDDLAKKIFPLLGQKIE